MAESDAFFWIDPRPARVWATMLERIGHDIEHSLQLVLVVADFVMINPSNSTHRLFCLGQEATQWVCIRRHNVNHK